ncbi:hypothetical protein VDGD_21029 [Verticillium dahliae]|nr:hypothetical protein VDGD_21029 [Verticillium dahliae]
MTRSSRNVQAHHQTIITCTINPKSWIHRRIPGILEELDPTRPVATRTRSRSRSLGSWQHNVSTVRTGRRTTPTACDL